MYEYIIGDIVSIYDDYIVLQNNGIGYKILCSLNSMVKLEMGMKSALIYTYMAVREDGIFLYGFTSEDEMDMFKLLLMVSKIGPKIALGVLSTLKPRQIKLAVLNKDIDFLCKAPGIGKKTAERIILELKDRIDKSLLEEGDLEEMTVSNDHNEAVDALASLGYTRLEVEKAIRGLDTKSMSVEEIIRLVLRELSKS